MGYRKLIAGLALAGALAAATPSAAVIYDAALSFSFSNPHGPWTYGAGVTGSTFTPFTTVSPLFTTGNAWNFGDGGPPYVGANSTFTPINVLSVFIPGNLLDLHPGPDTDAIVQFTAPFSGDYSMYGVFTILDAYPTGTTVKVFHNGDSLFEQDLLGPGADQTLGAVGGFATWGGSMHLALGDTISFGVNNLGDYSNDSTGLYGIIDGQRDGAPEPAAWALMLVGFLGLGAALRARRADAARSFA